MLRGYVEPTGAGEYVRVTATSRLINEAAPAGGRVVDLGGGEGNLRKRLRRDLRGAYTIVDRDPGKAPYRVVADLCRVGLADESADIVCVSDVLEHIPDDSALIREANRILRSGGTLIVHVPSLRASPFSFVVSAKEEAEEQSHQLFPHVRDGYDVDALSALLGDGSAVQHSFNRTQSLICDLDLYCWTRGLRLLRVPFWLLIRLTAVYHGSNRWRGGGSGLVGVSVKRLAIVECREND